MLAGENPTVGVTDVMRTPHRNVSLFTEAVAAPNGAMIKKNKTNPNRK